MPLIKSAKKKLRQDKKRQFDNKKIKSSFKSLVKEARENSGVKSVQNAFSMLDKAAKKGIIHKNKAARLKSSLSKLLSAGKKQQPAPEEKKAKAPKRKLITK